MVGSSVVRKKVHLCYECGRGVVCEKGRCIVTNSCIGIIGGTGECVVCVGSVASDPASQPVVYAEKCGA